tara:strand:- start:399 stop:647 length:249 start_codon:yes stop_codon:yes gene_type:complete
MPARDFLHDLEKATKYYDKGAEEFRSVVDNIISALLHLPLMHMIFLFAFLFLDLFDHVSWLDSLVLERIDAIKRKEMDAQVR